MRENDRTIILQHKQHIVTCRGWSFRLGNPVEDFAIFYTQLLVERVNEICYWWEPKFFLSQSPPVFASIKYCYFWKRNAFLVAFYQIHNISALFFKVFICKSIVTIIKGIGSRLSWQYNKWFATLNPTPVNIRLLLICFSKMPFHCVMSFITGIHYFCFYYRVVF